MASSSDTVSNLRTQGVVLRWAWPVGLGLAALGGGAQVSPTMAFGSVCVAVPVGLLFGFWAAAWFDAAAELLEYQRDSLAAVTALGNRLGPQLAEQHSELLKTLRLIGEHMVSGNTRNTELLRILAENTDSLTRLESNEHPANINQR